MNSNMWPLSFSLTGDGVNLSKQLRVADASRFPFPFYGPMEAALSFIARAGARTMIHTSGDLEYGLRQAHEHLFDLPLVVGDAPVVEIEDRDLPGQSSITVDRTTQTIVAFTGSDLVFTLPIETADYLAATLAHREEDRFYEARFPKEIEARRKIWTAACIAAAGALPCSGQLFVEAAEMMSFAIDPTTHWEPVPQSYRLRTLAAIHAGIVLFDPRTRLFVAHPCMEGWRSIIAPNRFEDWKRLQHAGMAFLILPDRLKLAIRAWASDLSGKDRASSHELIAAEDAMAPHEAELAFARQEIYPQLASVALIPPKPNAPQAHQL